jgi:ubiquinone/menaquinone biosynthesis C-methylase UbiE
MIVRDDWWVPEEEGGFFGPHYILGDNSKLGPYLTRRISLEERTEREVRYVLRALGLEPGQEVLDCPCGYGRHSVALAKRGVRVTGVDLNNYFLNHARRRAVEQKVDNVTTFVRGDMRELPLESDRYHAVINMFTSFGFFAKQDEDAQVLMEFHRVLKKGGLLLIHLDYNYERRMNPKYKDERVTRYLKDGSRLIVTEKVSKETKTMVGKWEIIQKNEKQLYSRSYSLRLYSMDDLQNMLENCGFRAVQKRGDMDDCDGELTSNSIETVIIAEK